MNRVAAIFFLFVLKIFVTVQVWPETVYISARDVDVTPNGPVKEVVKTLYGNGGNELWRNTSRFNEKKQMLQSIYDFGDWTFECRCDWNKDNLLTENTFYKDDNYYGRMAFKYENPPMRKYDLVYWSDDEIKVSFSRFLQQNSFSEYAQYDSMERLLAKEQYVRDASSYIHDHKIYNTEDKISYRTVSEYYSNGILREQKTYEDEGTIIYIRTNKLNELGKVAEYTEQNLDSGFITITTYDYDQKGRILEEKKNFNGMYSTQISYFYNDTNNQTIESMKDSQGKIYHYTVTTFDKRGNAIEIIYYYEGEAPLRYENTYNEQNRRVKEIQWKGDVMVYSYEVEFDIQNYRTWEIIFDRGKNWITTYRYDLYGNITERKVEENVGNLLPLVLDQKKVWEYTYFDTRIDDWKKY